MNPAQRVRRVRPSAWGLATGRTLDGGPLALSDLAGDVVVLNVCASWCPPCRAETLDLVRVAKQLAGDDVSFVGINSWDKPAATEAFVRNFDVPYPSLADPKRQLLRQFRGTILAGGIPATVVLDRQGRVAARVIGPVTTRTLNRLLDELITEGR